MHNESLFFTVVYPQALPYFKEVCDCARNQTRKDFDVVVVNDGCDKNTLETLLSGLKATILESAGTIAGNRLIGIEYAKRQHYKYLFFCDADDTFTSNRFERTINVFETSGTDIVVCNLNVADDKCNPVIKDYFSLEIPTDRDIDAEFLKNKNIIGMSNTALLVSSVPNGIAVPNIPIVDWFFFTVLLLKGLHAKYISDSMVNYRQYNANMIGITNFDVSSFRKLAKHKQTHYQMLVENGYPQYEQLYKQSMELTNLTDDEINELISHNLKEHPQPLWWQIITRNNN